MFVAIVYVVCAVVWGTTWFAIRRCIGDGGYPTFTSAGIRFALAGALLGLLYALGFGRPGPRGRRQLLALVACGVLSAASYGLVYRAEESISGGLASVLYGTFPLCTALIATLLRVERVTRRALLGSTISLAGIAVVFADRLQVSRAQAIGVLLVLASVVLSSLYSTIMKRAAADVSPLAMTGVFLGTASVPLGALGLAVDPKPVPWPPPLGPTLALLYLTIVGSVLVFLAYFFLLKKVTLMTVSTLVLIEPMIALAVDALYEHEVVLVPRSYAGMALTVAGVAVSVVQKKKIEGKA
jgi:drug/metabolite transporter (DMT)-like permease